MKALNYLVLIFFGFILLTYVFLIIQFIYYLFIGKVRFNKKAFTIKEIIRVWKQS